MTDIIALLACFDQCVDKTTVKQLNRIVVAMLTMTGRVTMLGISRWTRGRRQLSDGATLLRQDIAVVATICWLFVRHHLLNPEHEYLLAGDETVVTKAGKQTYGLDRFFSSLYGKPVPGVAFFAFSLVSVQERTFVSIVGRAACAQRRREASRSQESEGQEACSRE